MVVVMTMVVVNADNDFIKEMKGKSLKSFILLGQGRNTGNIL